MIEVTIDSVRVSLMSQARIVVLREENGERYLPIWIGPFEADAITIQLQGIEVSRPMTHDLLRQLIETLDGEVTHVVISDLQNDTFFAKIVLNVGGDTIEVDSRPSDAVALAVRVDAPIYVDEDVMDRAGMEPEEELSLADKEGRPQRESAGDYDEDDEDLDVFRDFIEGLDIDNLG
ncbi:bifunctional nuclease family protein [bacterium]|jgi:bifunctional DNase/RNase|nr:bifunctional nuclease family protein [bacterium]